MSSVRYAEGEAYKIALFPARRDNYGFLLHDELSGATAAIDTPEVEPIVSVLEANDWKLTHILNTHHHFDHAGGNNELRRMYPDVLVAAPRREVSMIGHVDVPVSHGDIIAVGSLEVEVLDVGGHTLGHVAYYSPVAHSCFVGDAIFVLGCGRMFEGTYDQFHASLQRIKALPPETELFCGHEYTEANAKFAATIETDNKELFDRIEAIKQLRAKGLPTVPTTVDLEQRTNPFIRLDAVRTALGLPDQTPDVEVFALVRQKKDSF